MPFRNLLFFLLLLSPILQAKQKQMIKVGVAHRAPYYMDGEQGLAVNFVSAMNKVSEDFVFKLVGFPTQRKFQALEDGWIDLMMWDNPKWGWKGQAIAISQPLIKSADVYVTLNLNGRDQSFFKDLESKELAFTRGFHYRFADYEIDPSKLQKRFLVTLVRNEEDAINMVLDNRVEIAVTNNVTLAWHFNRFPRHKELLLVADQIDTEFNRYAIIPEKAKITVEQFNEVLSKMSELGLTKNIFGWLGVQVPNYRSDP